MTPQGWNWPNIDGFINETWGWPQEVAGPGFSIASNIVVGCNPPFTPADFLAFYPNFGGNPLVIGGCTITAGSPVVVGEPPSGIFPGMIVSLYLPNNGQLTPGPFPDGTTIVSFDSGSITMSRGALVDDTQVAIYNAPFIPLLVLIAYINLASSSLVWQRWRDQWRIGMLLYIAHFCTLYLRSNGSVANSAGQLATAGLARGITISKSAGGVSVGVQPATQGGLEGWGHWTETGYGVQFCTMARVLGSGPLLIR